MLASVSSSECIWTFFITLSKYRVSLWSYPWAPRLSQTVAAKAHVLWDKYTVLRDTIKGTLCYKCKAFRYIISSLHFRGSFCNGCSYRVLIRYSFLRSSPCLKPKSPHVVSSLQIFWRKFYNFLFFPMRAICSAHLPGFVCSTHCETPTNASFFSLSYRSLNSVVAQLKNFPILS